MAKFLIYDYSLMSKKAVGRHGINLKKVKALNTKMKSAHKAAHKILSSGEQGFVKALSKKTEIAQWANKIKGEFDQLLVVGIGGSDLGARALQEIFSDKKKSVEVLFLGDTMDPVEIKRVCDKISWKRCAINVVSKSGSTVETLAVFFYVREQLVKAVGRNSHAGHIFITTEDRCVALYKLIEQEGYSFIAHPQNIGGRWTVLTQVGLLSAAVAGINYQDLRRGARDMYRRCQKPTKNPALMYAVLHYLGVRQGQPQAVLMPYSSQLEKFGAWYRQLFGESLAKEKNRRKKKVNTGLTPIVSVGPKDQHSQIQLYNEGPFDKLITFIRIENSRLSTKIPRKWKGEEGRSHLDGWEFHRIQNMEQESTAMSLRSHGRPSGTLILPDLSEYSAGQLFMFFELACVYLAEFFDINAFDQPGVEEGKKWMHAMMGKEGYEKEKAKLEKEKKGVRKLVV